MGKTFLSLILGAIIVIGLVFWWMRPAAAAPETAQPKNLQPGPIRHATLPPELEARISRFEAVFVELYPQTHEQWMDGFKRDANPESEVAIWENIAAAYQTFTSAHRLGKEQRDEAFGLLILRSSVDERTALSSAKPGVLNAAQVQELMRLYGAPPKPITYTKD